MVTLHQRRRLTDHRKVTEADLDARNAEWRAFHDKRMAFHAAPRIAAMRRAAWHRRALLLLIATGLIASVAAATFPLWA